jgi:hypothetical protein
MERSGRPSLLILGALLIAALARYRLVLKRRPGGWAPPLERAEDNTAPCSLH